MIPFLAVAAVAGTVGFGLGAAALWYALVFVTSDEGMEEDRQRWLDGLVHPY